MSIRVTVGRLLVLKMKKDGHTLRKSTKTINTITPVQPASPAAAVAGLHEACVPLGAPDSLAQRSGRRDLLWSGAESPSQPGSPGSLQVLDGIQMQWRQHFSGLLEHLDSDHCLYVDS